MKRLITIGLLLALMAAPMLAQNAADPAGALTTDVQKYSYAIGVQWARNMAEAEMQIDAAAMMRGMKDVMAEAKLQLDDKQIEDAIALFEQQMRQKVAERAAAIRRGQADENLKDGKAFLAENARQTGVKVTATGLQYQVVREGDGPKPTIDDSVTVHYRGTLIDGTEFDSSYKRGQPATFPVGGVIKGWTEALQLMKKGAKYKLFIPAELAYGERGAGERIGPNMVLLFEVELLDIKKN